MWTSRMAALAGLAVAVSPASATDYGCGRLVRGDGRFTAVLVAEDAAGSGRSRPGASARAALVVCSARGCGARTSLGTTQPVALAWQGDRLVLFSDARLVLDHLDRTAGYSVEVRPLAGASSPNRRVLRFPDPACYRRPSAGG